MRFAAKEEIQAPIEAVFAALSDFAGFERLAMSKGAEIRRTDTRSTVGAGMTWDMKFRLRGRARQIAAKLEAHEPPTGMRLTGRSPNLDLVAVVTLVALSRQRTRISVELDVTPRTLPARILIQSARLGKGTLTRRFEARVSRFAHHIGNKVATGAV